MSCLADSCWQAVRYFNNFIVTKDEAKNGVIGYNKNLFSMLLVNNLTKEVYNKYKIHHENIYIK